jgi:hypothetical protein
MAPQIITSVPVPVRARARGRTRSRARTVPLIHTNLTPANGAYS